MSTQNTAGTAREGMTMSDETTRLRALLERTAARVLTVAEERDAATKRAERAEHMHATVLASLTHALAQGDALNAEAKDMHDRMTAAEVRATAAERERDDLAATLETRTAEHALAMERVRELEAAARLRGVAEGAALMHTVISGAVLCLATDDGLAMVLSALDAHREGRAVTLRMDLAPTAEVSRAD